MSTVRLGIFIVVALAVFAAGVFLIGSNQLLFNRTYPLNAAFDTVAGLIDGAEVRVGGIHKGTVRSIELPRRPDQKVLVRMDLDRGTRAVVKKDSRASIQAEGLIGDEYVEVSFGSPESPEVRDGDTIASVKPLEFSELVKKANGILDNMQGAMKNVDQVAGNVQDISNKIDQGQGTLGALVNDRQMYQRANAGVTAFSEDMEALKHNFLLRGFFKSRGFEDSAEIGKHEIARLPAAPPAGTFEYDARKLFAKSDSAKLTKPKDLAAAGRALESGFGMAIVAVDAGAVGDTAKDRELTRERASVVREYLAQNFKLDDTRVKTLGMGKTGSGDGQVRILIYPEPAKGAPVAKARR